VRVLGRVLVRVLVRVLGRVLGRVRSPRQQMSRFHLRGQSLIPNSSHFRLPNPSLKELELGQTPVL
jgi:hypothetical protein